MPPNGHPQLNASGDRVALAARLYNAGKAEHVVCTGSRIKELSTSETDGALRAQEILIELGVAADDISLVPGRNTSEEIRNLKKFLNDSERDETTKVGILTSAWHLERAMGLAERNGPCGYADPLQLHDRGN